MSRAPADGAEPTPVRLARWLSVRALVLGLVVLVGFALLFPSVRAHMAQRAELDALAARLLAAEEQEQELRAELDRWDDPAYVQAQARHRLMFVFPGETAFRVIDPEVVVEQPVLDGGNGVEAGPALPFGGSSGTPWYSTVWESVGLAGAYGYEPLEAAEDDVVDGVGPVEDPADGDVLTPTDAEADG